MTPEQRKQLKAQIITSVSPLAEKAEGGWIKSIDLGPIIKSANIDYKALGFLKLTPFLLELFGKELEIQGEKLSLQVRFPKTSSNLDKVENSEKNTLKPTVVSDSTSYVQRDNAYSRILKFAFFPKPYWYDNNGFEYAIEQLAKKANKEERWYYGELDPGDYPILRNYFLMTFERLQSEDDSNLNNPNWDKRLKIVRNTDNTFGIPRFDKASNTRIFEYPDNILLFNTGLVDDLYEPVYAVFYSNTHGEAPWKFHKFISGSGEDNDHMFLAKLYGDKFPLPAKYYKSTLQLVYDITKPIAAYNWSHIIDRCNRLPIEFLEDNCTKEIDESRDTEGNIDYKLLSEKIKKNHRVHRQIQNRIKDAVEHALKRVEWNFKTAIPIYYPGGKDISLLLPLSLMGENNKIDAALVLESDATTYIAHTILKLNMAYANARLITRPDSDWLTPANITTANDIEIEIDE